MLILTVLSLFTMLHMAIMQNITTLDGRCDRRTAYFYGACRVPTCLANETTITGQSYCDVYRAYLRRPFVRCTPTLPCCVRGGVCRRACGVGESQMTLETDCTVSRTSVCCVRNTANIPQVSTAAPRGTVAQRQGRSQYPVTLAGDRPQSEECGTSTSVQGRFANGAVAQPTSWPWVIRLVFSGNSAGACAGVLVDNDTVVTVAHCVARTPSNQLQVHVGDFDTGRVDPDEELVNVRNIEVNRNFVPGSRGNDFAILKLARPINYTENKLPICLPDPALPLARPPSCFVAGWGVTGTGQVNTQLRVTPVRIIDTDVCSALIPGASTNITSLGNDTICTEPLNNQGDGCLFDDGGMLSCLDINNRYTLIGLVSHYSCAGQPTIYTRVDNYIETILSRL